MDEDLLRLDARLLSRRSASASSGACVPIQTSTRSALPCAVRSAAPSARARDREPRRRPRPAWPARRTPRRCRHGRAPSASGPSSAARYSAREFALSVAAGRAEVPFDRQSRSASLARQKLSATTATPLVTGTTAMIAAPARRSWLRHRRSSACRPNTGQLATAA